MITIAMIDNIAKRITAETYPNLAMRPKPHNKQTT
jgi:hypothetical protein